MVELFTPMCSGQEDLAEFQWRQLFESTREGGIISRLDGTIIAANQAAASILGYKDPPELKRVSARDLYGDPNLRQLILERLNKEGSVDMEGALRRKDGALIPALGTLTLIQDVKGKDQYLGGYFKDIIERKRTERELFEVQHHLKSIVEAAPIILWAVDTNGIITISEGRSLEALGVQPGQLVGQSVFELYKDYPEALAPIYRGLAGEEFRTETEVEGFFWDNFYTPLRNEKGDVVGLMGITTDITERRRVELALRDSEARYRDLVEHSEDLICTHDLKGNVMSANLAMVRRLGYERAEELVGRKITDFLAPKVRHLFEPYLETIVRDGYAKGLLNISTHSGEERILEYHNSLRTEGLDKPIVRGMAHDVTERFRAEEALRESEERYRAIFEQAVDSILLVDGETGELVEFNDRAHEILGYTRSEFEKLKIPDFEVVESTEEVSKHIDKILAEKKDSFETKHRTKSGDLRDVIVRSRAITIGGKDFVLSVLRDITELKKAEREREELQARLVQAEKMATIGQVAAGVAHTLNTPLNNISLTAEHLLKILKDPEVQEDLKLIKQQVFFSARIIKDLLAYSHEIEPTYNSLDLGNFLQRHDFRVEIQRPEITLTKNLEEGLPRVRADPNQLLILLRNLVENASDAILGSGRITISARRRNQELSIVVKDTGKGIHKEEISQIFKPFFTTKPIGKGSGLGLSIVQRIVEAHDGRIMVDSIPGRGTEIEVFLSVADAPKFNDNST